MTSEALTVFIGFEGFGGAAGVHIFHLANAIIAQGGKAIAVVDGEPGDAQQFGEPRFSIRTVREAIADIKSYDGKIILHCWTPRVRSARVALRLHALRSDPLVVHFEDDEESIRRVMLSARPWWRRRSANVDQEGLSARLMRQAVAATYLAASPRHRIPPFLPAHRVRLGFDQSFQEAPQKDDQELRERLSIPADAVVVFYAGTGHRLNAGDIVALYDGVAMLADRGYPVVLLRAGKDHSTIARHYDLGQIPWARHLPDAGPGEFPELVGAADITVLPGRQNDFNAGRVPSKLPFLLASGTAVVTARFGLQPHLRDGVEARILRESTGIEIAEIVQELAADKARREALGDAGRAYALHHFSWERSADELMEFYARRMAGNKGLS